MKEDRFVDYDCNHALAGGVVRILQHIGEENLSRLEDMKSILSSEQKSL